MPTSYLERRWAIIGRILAHYEITAKLGAGGMGEVYLATDTKLERQIALKVLPAELSGDPARLGRLQREAKALAALDHPGIVTIHSVEEAEGIHFLTMAHVAGQTLDALTPTRGMPVEQVLEFGSSLADALRAAHEGGIVHRDLKPGNVMVDAEGRLRVLDFGLARVDRTVPLTSHLSTVSAEAPMTLQGMVLGTVPYMSPEQAEGKRVDFRSDLFSLGIVLYEMTTGSRPFAGDTAASLISSILRDTPAPVTDHRPDVPADLDRLIQRCLEKDPEDRYPAAAAVRDEFDAIQRDVRSMTVSGAMPSGSTTSKGGALRLAAVAALLVVIAGVVTWQRGIWSFGAGREVVGAPGAAAVAQIRSIAVMPMRNLSGDPQQEYFADGMTEALITNLSKIGALKVIARSSAMRYKNGDRALSEIAAELGVDAVVEGSVIRENETVGITAQLIEVAGERVIWGEQFQRDFTGIFQLQGELATAIAGGIRLALSPEEEALLSAAADVDPEAYEAYLKGRFHWYRFTPADLKAAKQYFETALEKDPNYALAYVGLADAIATPPHIGMESPVEPFARARSLIEKALELHPDLAEAHDMRARIAFVQDWDWQGAGRGFRRALELNPNLPDAHVVYSQYLGILGRHDEALEQAEQGVSLDPLNFFFRQQRSERLAWIGRHEESIAGYRELIESGGDLPFLRRALWDELFATGRYDEAYEEARRYYESAGPAEILEVLQRGYSDGGYSGAMSSLAEHLEAVSSSRYVAAADIAKLHVHAGQNEEALDWLEKSIAVPETRLVYVTVDPVFHGLHDHPRFQSLRARMNL